MSKKRDENVVYVPADAMKETLYPYGEAFCYDDVHLPIDS